MVFSEVFFIASFDGIKSFVQFTLTSLQFLVPTVLLHSLRKSAALLRYVRDESFDRWDSISDRNELLAVYCKEFYETLNLFIVEQKQARGAGYEAFLCELVQNDLNAYK